MREQARLIDAEALAKASGISLERVGRFLAGKSLGYHDVPKVGAALGRIESELERAEM